MNPLQELNSIPIEVRPHKTLDSTDKRHNNNWHPQLLMFSLLLLPQVTVNDPDGSESYVVSIADNLPEGTRIFGVNGTELLLTEDGNYILSPEDAEELTLLPPLHYSSALSGNIVVTATALVTDGNSTANFTIVVEVDVEGVADPPLTNPVTVVVDEDQTYILGDTLNLTGVLVDVSTIFGAVKT